MSTMKINMMHWWAGRQARERKVIFLGGICGALIGIYVLLWLPLTEQAQKAKQDLHNKQALVTWMQPQVQTLLQLRAAQPSASATDKNLTALIIVEREMKTESLSTYTPQIKQGQNDEVQIVFKAVPFDDLIQWLGDMGQRFNLRVVAANMSPIDQVGMVQASLTVAR